MTTTMHAATIPADTTNEHHLSVTERLIMVATILVVLAVSAGLAIPVLYIGTHVHPIAGAAMVPAGAALFVALVWRSNPSKAGR